MGGTGAVDAGLGGVPDAGPGDAGPGVSDDSGDDGGCGCRTAPGPSRSAWLLVLGAAALLRRSRKRLAA